MSPERDMDFLGWTNLHVSRLTGQLKTEGALIIEETCIESKFSIFWPFILREWDFARKNLYYDVTALAAAAQSHETWQGDITSGGRHKDLSSLHVTSLDQSYFFICHFNYMYMRYNSNFCEVITNKENGWIGSSIGK